MKDDHSMLIWRGIDPRLMAVLIVSDAREQQSTSQDKACHMNTHRADTRQNVRNHDRLSCVLSYNSLAVGAD